MGETSSYLATPLDEAIIGKLPEIAIKFILAGGKLSLSKHLLNSPTVKKISAMIKGIVDLESEAPKKEDVAAAIDAEHVLCTATINIVIDYSYVSNHVKEVFEALTGDGPDFF